MDGRIWVESEEGNGSTFHFTSRVKAMPARPMLPSPEFANINVLVVEDQATARRVLSDTLTSWSARVTAVASVQQAVAAVRTLRELEASYSLALVDVSLPDSDCFSLVEKLNRASEGVLPVIYMLRPSTKVADAVKSREAGGAGFVTKPLRQQELREIMRSVLTRSSRFSSLQLFSRSSDTPGLKLSKRPLRILLAEDNPVNQRLTLRLLEKRGHSVLAAADGVEALEAVSREKFDLVLMDIQMPRLDGFQVTALIRENERLTGDHLPIVAMTANVLKGDEERCLTSGMDHYVSKPVDQKKLFEIIERLTPSISAASA
jgi:CheY-like chemotaxis protein